LEYIFLQLRARSVNEIVNLKYNCNNKIKNDNDEEKECGNVVDFDLNLLEIEPTKFDSHTNKIELNENLGVVMKYPTFTMMDKLNLQSNDMDQILDVIINCVDYIYDKDNLYYAKDSTKEELVEFIESMQQTDLEKIQQFFDTLPKLKKELDFNCNKCGYHEKITVEGIQSFFG
jgi:hypothetical protein